MALRNYKINSIKTKIGKCFLPARMREGTFSDMNSCCYWERFNYRHEELLSLREINWLVPALFRHLSCDFVQRGATPSNSNQDQLVKQGMLNFEVV